MLDYGFHAARQAISRRRERILDVEEPEKGGPDPAGAPRALVGLGIEMAASIVLCMYAGYRMDRWLDTKPLWFLVGAILGMVLGFYNFFRRVLR